MAGSIQQIQQELTALETAIAQLAQEFEKVYQNYLTVLGQAINKQLVLACYHLCTHGYPESFLQLSFSQRQKFQQEIRQLSTEAQTELLTLLSPVESLQQSEHRLELALNEESQPSEEQQPTGSAQSEALNRLQFILHPSRPQTPPERLIAWQEKIESAISHLLSQLSRDTNFRIQKFNIFAPKLPEAILEAASQSEAAAETVAGPPNLLNIMIETEDAEEPQSASNDLVAVKRFYNI